MRDIENNFEIPTIKKIAIISNKITRIKERLYKLDRENLELKERIRRIETKIENTQNGNNGL